MADPRSIRAAVPSEQAELTRLAVRATMRAGYDAAFINRSMPALTVTLPSINAGNVLVIEREDGVILGVVIVAVTSLRGIARLDGIFVEPSLWRQGLGRALFDEAVVRAKTVQAGALIVYAEPSAAGFYARVGAVRIGECPFYYSPELVLPTFLYIIQQRGPC